jgi:hypothetical protein
MARRAAACYAAVERKRGSAGLLALALRCIRALNIVDLPICDIQRCHAVIQS